MNKPRKPSVVLLSQEALEFIDNIQEGTYEWGIVKNANDTLSENIFAGKQLEKRRIPKYYVQKYGVTNLHILKLDSDKRLIFTWITADNGVGICVLELFHTHKEYEQRFGYK